LDEKIIELVYYKEAIAEIEDCIRMLEKDKDASEF